MHPSRPRTVYCLLLYLYHLIGGTDSLRMLLVGDSICSIVKSVSHGEYSSFQKTEVGTNDRGYLLGDGSHGQVDSLKFSMIGLTLPSDVL